MNNIYTLQIHTHDYDYGWETDIVVVSYSKDKLIQFAAENYPEYKYEDFSRQVDMYDHYSVDEVICIN